MARKTGRRVVLYRPFDWSLRENRLMIGFVILIWVVSVVLFSIPYFLMRTGVMEFRAIAAHVLIGVVGIFGSFLLLVAIPPLLDLPRKLSFSLMGLLVLVVSAIMSTIDIVIFEFLAGFFMSANEAIGQAPYSVRWFANFSVFSAQFFSIGAMIGGSEMVRRQMRSEGELEQVRRLAAEAQSAANVARLQALRYQLNPHFLFNTLNSISSLIVTRRNEQGEAMLEQLSAFLRKTLVAEPSSTHSLEQELETVDAYLAIERIRFGERLAVEVDCPAALREAGVPPFLLQPLVENAVKYGVSSTDRQVTVRIEALRDEDDLVLTVEDDGEGGAAPVQGGTGIGLRNVRERLTALYGERARFESLRREKGFLAVVRLPLSVEEGQ